MGNHHEEHKGCNGKHRHDAPEPSPTELPKPEVKRIPAPKHANFQSRWATFKENVQSRFSKGIDPTHEVIDEHGHHKPFTFETAHKTGAVLGAIASVGVAIHGGRNVVRGISGYEDSMGEKHEPSWLTTVMGGGEIFAGLAGLARCLSGRWIP